MPSGWETPGADEVWRDTFDTYPNLLQHLISIIKRYIILHVSVISVDESVSALHISVD